MLAAKPDHPSSIPRPEGGRKGLPPASCSDRLLCMYRHVCTHVCKNQKNVNIFLQKEIMYYIHNSTFLYSVIKRSLDLCFVLHSGTIYLI